MKSKIGYKLVLSIVLFSSLITLFSTAVQIFMDYQGEMNRINTYDALIRKSYLTSIVASVWRYDEEQVTIQLNGILALPDMEHLEIRSDTGFQWFVGSIQSKRNLIREFPLQQRYKGEAVNIGVLQAVISLDSIYARLFKKALTILASNAIKTFLVSGFTLLIFQYLLTRHLYSLSHWLKHLDIGKSFEKFQLNRSSGKPGKTDELDEVVLAINEMQDNLKHHLRDLARSEKKYKILTENIPLKVFHKDIHSAYVACNRNFAEEFNMEADQISGKTDFDLFPKELAEKYRFDDIRIMESQKRETFEEQYLRPGGDEACIQTIKTPVWDEENTVIGLIGAFIDVTELKTVKKELGKSEDRFKRLIENLKDSHFFYSRDTLGRFTYVSPSITNVLGYREESFLTHQTRYITEARINKEAAQRTEMSTHGVKQLPYEIELFHKNGSIRQLQVTETPVFDRHGKPIAVEGLAQDITEIKKIETQLRQAQKMEAIGTLAGGIAHDFNNILSLILGYAEMVREDAPHGSTIAEDIDKVLKAGHRAKDLVKQILAFSRQSDTERISFKPASIVREASKMLRHSIPTTIEISEDIDPDCRLILAAPTQIHQILMNLCINAFHAMEHTGGTIFISLKNREIHPDDLISNETGLLQGSFVELLVRDTGPGIDPSLRDKIFNPYFTTKEVGKGTGMGLSITHGILQSYGGAIILDSVQGEGANFHVFFPVTQQQQIEVKGVEPILAGSERILLVDDEELLVNMGKDMLSRLGYNVTTRQSSIDALELFTDRPDQFDLVITDQTMPGMTGAELSRRMMQIRPDIPIILCTGYSAILSKTQAKAMGIKEFALKPLVKKDIAGIIRKVLDTF